MSQEKPYQPTRKEIEKAENIISSEQRVKSQERIQDIEGWVLAELNALTSEEDYKEQDSEKAKSLLGRLGLEKFSEIPQEVFESPRIEAAVKELLPSILANDPWTFIDDSYLFQHFLRKFVTPELKPQMMEGARKLLQKNYVNSFEVTTEFLRSFGVDDEKEFWRSADNNAMISDAVSNHLEHSEQIFGYHSRDGRSMWIGGVHAAGGFKAYLKDLGVSVEPIKEGGATWIKETLSGKRNLLFGGKETEPTQLAFKIVDVVHEFEFDEPSFFSSEEIISSLEHYIFQFAKEQFSRRLFELQPPEDMRGRGFPQDQIDLEKTRRRIKPLDKKIEIAIVDRQLEALMRYFPALSEDRLKSILENAFEVALSDQQSRTRFIEISD